MAPGVTGLVPTGWVPFRVPVAGTVVPGEYTVPAGVAPMGALMAPAGVAPTGVLIEPGTAPVLVPTCPGATVPVVMGALVAPGVPGTVVCAKATLLTPSPSRAAKKNPEVFIYKSRIKKGKKRIVLSLSSGSASCFLRGLLNLDHEFFMK